MSLRQKLERRERKIKQLELKIELMAYFVPNIIIVEINKKVQDAFFRSRKKEEGEDSIGEEMIQHRLDEY